MGKIGKLEFRSNPLDEWQEFKNDLSRYYNNNKQKETTNMKVFQYVIATVDEDGELLKVVDTGNAVKMAAEDVIAEILIERGKDLSKQYGPYDEDDGWEILVRPFV